MATNECVEVIRGVCSTPCTLIIRLLNRRIGEIDSSTIERVQGLSIEQLETLGEALLEDV
ncbi:DUF4351 domain-containing protein [Nostoc edaphicum CCNP1411]|uniref:DUF4351 domain-containing protein n=1 Tax=Nostoc edaphicum CCNP1411 TaxID=1472755 RepID=A0A7D7LF89_9NOSO|nr:DUF4351 domain-containing protein [Nostoc edaphicum CCNP1411]